LPPLVRGGLLAEGPTAIVEVLSELRVLAIASKQATHDVMTPDEAFAFLNTVMMQNLAFLSSDGTEDSRKRPATYARAGRLMKLLLDRLSPETVLGSLADEIDALCAQRPILTKRTRELIDRAAILLPCPGALIKSAPRLASDAPSGPRVAP
jgi:hypothetical protein